MGHRGESSETLKDSLKRWTVHSTTYMMSSRLMPLNGARRVGLSDLYGCPMAHVMDGTHVLLSAQLVSVQLMALHQCANLDHDCSGGGK